MKEFSLGEYIKNPNREVITRDGRKVRVLCTDRKGAAPIIALINGGLPDCKELCYSFFPDGKKYENCESDADLFFAPTKHEGWINIKKTALGYYCSSNIFQTKEDAENHEIGGNCLVVTKKVEWEE